ncbi:MAG TPA: cytidylate kinase family protein [Actinomycetota bacterium]|nr:cytidylate kinase family protein [Actinomycetota bacterium]
MSLVQADRRPVVTLAALYGTGGAIVGQRVADRLEVEFFDRAITSAIAERTGLTEHAVGAGDRPKGGVDRLVATLARVSDARTATGRQVERVGLEEQRLRGEIDSFMVRAGRAGGVVVGRGGAVVLASLPGVLHVYLDGPQDGRVAQVMEAEQVDRRTAERLVTSHDRARREYVWDFYGVDGDDPSLYHLRLDAVALGIGACVELIVLASRYRTGSER